MRRGESGMKHPANWWVAIFVCLVLLSTLSAQQPTPAYEKPALPIETRVSDLLSRMTLEEKVAQLESTWQNHSQGLLPEEYFVNDKGKLDAAKAREALKNGLGQVTRPSEGRGPGELAEFTNGLQRIAMENTRLEIPLMFHEECLHGLVAADATSYPQAIGLAATWDDALFRRIFDATAREARSCGVRESLVPVVDLARDPRWGRTEETYGEDPYLAGRMGVAAVRGLQGDGPTIE